MHNYALCHVFQNTLLLLYCSSMSLAFQVKHVNLHIVAYIFEGYIDIYFLFSGASFYNATDAASFCVSGNMINTLTCTALTCGDPKLDPDGNPVPDLIVNGDDADIESWPWQVSLRSVSMRR